MELIKNIFYLIGGVLLGIVALIMMIVTMWPFICIGLICVFILSFFTTVGAWILFGLICLALLTIYIVKLI